MVFVTYEPTRSRFFNSFEKAVACAKNRHHGKVGMDVPAVVYIVADKATVYDKAFFDESRAQAFAKEVNGEVRELYPNF